MWRAATRSKRGPENKKNQSLFLRPDKRRPEHSRRVDLYLLELSKTQFQRNSIWWIEDHVFGRRTAWKNRGAWADHWRDKRGTRTSTWENNQETERWRANKVFCRKKNLYITIQTQKIRADREEDSQSRNDLREKQVSICPFSNSGALEN